MSTEENNRPFKSLNGGSFWEGFYVSFQENYSRIVTLVFKCLTEMFKF